MQVSINCLNSMLVGAGLGAGIESKARVEVRRLAGLLLYTRDILSRAESNRLSKIPLPSKQAG